MHLGCALYQEQNGKLRILGFGSRTLVGAEKKYHSSKLEFLGLKWAMDHFRDYLYYAEHFDVYTDFNLLTYIKTSCKLNATGQRWVNELANFQFSVKYKPGIQNNVADSLSRFPKSSQDLEGYGKICSVEEVRAIFDGSLNQANGEETWIPLINNITVKEKVEEDQLLYDATNKTIALTTQDSVKAQKEESWIKRLFETKKNGIKLDKSRKKKEK